MGEKIFESAQSRLSFDRHLYFTNFSTLGLKMPVYLNLIRTPFYYARVTPRPGAVTPSGYHYPHPPATPPSRSASRRPRPECTFVSGRCMTSRFLTSADMRILQIKQTCQRTSTVPTGIKTEKKTKKKIFPSFHHRELNNMAALNTAKTNVERWYPVVGILEDLNATLAVLQDRLPGFFEGVLDMYYNQLLAPHHNRNRHRPSVSQDIDLALRKNLTTEYEFYDYIRQRLTLQYQDLKGRGG
nr:heparan sulfate 2-O-sulfotransferase pipe-like [Penaeus vannamei]